MQEVGVSYLSHKSLVIDGGFGVVAGTKHMLGSSRVTDYQKAAGRSCKNTASIKTMTDAIQVARERLGGGGGQGRGWGHRPLSAVPGAVTTQHHD